MNIVHSLYTLDGISAAGVCAMDALEAFLSEPQKKRRNALCPHAKSVLVALFPYYAGDGGGNLSLYARGRDYHTVIREILSPFITLLQREYPHNRFIILADDSPLPERRAAALSGAGVLGDNGLIFDAIYGSYVFIGTILTDLPIPPILPISVAENARRCQHCGACRRVCPLGALDEKGGVCSNRCLSALTQNGGGLTSEQLYAVARHPLIWGCDLCQQICPANRNAPLTSLPAFLDHHIDSLTCADLEGLTRRQFCEKYPDRAFTWKGPAPLRRNLALRKDASK